MWRNIVLFLINRFFSKTRFFGIKRKLLNSIKNVTIEKNVRIVGPLFFGKINQLVIKSGTWVGRDFSIEGNGSVIIQNNVDIGPHVVILTGTHLVGDESRRAGPGRQLHVTIESGCWICSRTTILGDVTIGHSSIVGACCFVNKDIEPNSLAASSFCKVVKKYQD